MQRHDELYIYTRARAKFSEVTVWFKIWFFIVSFYIYFFVSIHVSKYVPVGTCVYSTLLFVSLKKRVGAVSCVVQLW